MPNPRRRISGRNQRGGLPELSDDSTSFEQIDSGISSSRSLPNGAPAGDGVTWVELMRGDGSRLIPRNEGTNPVAVDRVANGELECWLSLSDPVPDDCEVWTVKVIRGDLGERLTREDSETEFSRADRRTELNRPIRSECTIADGRVAR